MFHIRKTKRLSQACSCTPDFGNVSKTQPCNLFRSLISYLKAEIKLLRKDESRKAIFYRGISTWNYYRFARTCFMYKISVQSKIQKYKAIHMNMRDKYRDRWGGVHLGVRQNFRSLLASGWDAIFCENCLPNYRVLIHTWVLWPQYVFLNRSGREIECFAKT
jgi:hypothetical protein